MSAMAIAPEFTATFSRRVVCGSGTTSPKFSVDMSFKEIEVCCPQALFQALVTKCHCKLGGVPLAMQ